MTKLISLLAAAGLLAAVAVESAQAGQFHPLRTAKSAVDLGLNTAKRAVDLGLDTAEGALDVAEDAVTPDNCPSGKRYRDRDGVWHTCR